MLAIIASMGENMKKVLGKTIIVLITVFVIMNAVFPNATFANNSQDVINDPLKDKDVGVLDGLFGILLYPIKLLLLIPGVLVNLALTGIAALGGDTLKIVTLKKILFNELAITKINVFEIEGVPDTIATIRTSIAGFYVALRNLSIVLSLAVLIYIGIQMARNNVAEDKAKYKQMLTNWLVGFGLIFILHYIIIFVINANEILIASLNASDPNTDYMARLLEQAWWIPFTTSFASIIMYVVLLFTTFIFLIIYIKRMITISFLIIIAPLISVTYSIDKIDNNRSEILNTWLKEFLYNVLIQPFHCIIYSVFIGMSLDLIGNGTDFGAMVLSVILTFGIFLGQKIVKEIFGFSESSSLAEKVAIFSMAKNTITNVRNIVAIKGSRNEKVTQKKIQQLPTNMPNGQKTDLNVIVRMRQLSQQKLDEENSKSKTSKTTPPSTKKTSSSSGTGKAKTKKRRILKNAPRPIRRVARLYRDTLATTSGYNLTRKIINNHRAKRVYQMTDDDYFLAGTESFRQAVDPNMTNKKLALEWERIYNETNISNLKGPAEVNYKLLIESMKKSYNKNGTDAYQAMSQSILYGTSNNKMWRK